MDNQKVTSKGFFLLGYQRLTMVCMWMFHFHTGRLVLLKCLWTAPIFDETILIIEVFLWNWPFVPSPMLKLLSSKYQPRPQILVPPQLTDFAASRLYHHRGLGEVVGSSTPDKDAGNRHRGSWCWGTFGNLVISSNCPRIKGKFTPTPTYFLGKSMVDFPSNQSIEVSSADADVCRNDGDSPSQKAGGWALGRFWVKKWTLRKIWGFPLDFLRLEFMRYTGYTG